MHGLGWIQCDVYRSSNITQKKADHKIISRFQYPIKTNFVATSNFILNAKFVLCSSFFISFVRFDIILFVTYRTHRVEYITHSSWQLIFGSEIADSQKWMNETAKRCENSKNLIFLFFFSSFSNKIFVHIFLRSLGTVCQELNIVVLLVFLFILVFVCTSVHTTQCKTVYECLKHMETQDVAINFKSNDKREK